MRICIPTAQTNKKCALGGELKGVRFDDPTKLDLSTKLQVVAGPVLLSFFFICLFVCGVCAKLERICALLLSAAEPRMAL